MPIDSRFVWLSPSLLTPQTKPYPSYHSRLFSVKPLEGSKDIAGHYLQCFTNSKKPHRTNENIFRCFEFTSTTQQRISSSMKCANDPHHAPFRPTRRLAISQHRDLPCPGPESLRRGSQVAPGPPLSCPDLAL